MGSCELGGSTRVSGELRNSMFAGVHLCNVHKFVQPSIRHIISCLQIFKQIFRNKLIFNYYVFTFFYLFPISVIIITIKLFIKKNSFIENVISGECRIQCVVLHKRNYVLLTNITNLLRNRTCASSPLNMHARERTLFFISIFMFL